MDELSRREVLVGAGALSGAVAFGALGSSTVAAGGRDRPDDVDAEVPMAWFDLALTLVQSTPGFTPPVAARAFAYTGIALYESVVAGSHRHRSLAKMLPGLRRLPRRHGNVHWATVANSALASILRALFPTTSAANKATVDRLESSFADRFRRRPSYRRSIAHGRDVARAVFDWSRSDGGHEGYLRNFPPDYVPPVGPGLWVPTPPGVPTGAAAVLGGQPLLRDRRRDGLRARRPDRVLEGPAVIVVRRGGRGVRRGQQPRRRTRGDRPILGRRPRDDTNPARPLDLDRHPSADAPTTPR